MIRLLLLLCCCTWLAAAVTVELLPEARIAGAVATLGDIARCEGPQEDLVRLHAIEVQAMPDMGQRDIDARRVQALISRQLPGLQVSVSGSCTARRVGCDFTAEDFATAARNELVGRLGELEGDATLVVQRAAPLVALPADAREPYRLQAEPLSMNDWGEIPYRVRIMQGQQERRRVLLVLRLDRYRDQLICTRDLPRGHVLSAADLCTRRVLVGDAATATAPDLERALGCLTRGVMQAGQPLTIHHIERPPLVRGGAAVQLCVETARFSITVSGVALGDGREGEIVAVRPTGDRRVLRGRVVSAGKVVVEQ